MLKRFKYLILVLTFVFFSTHTAYLYVDDMGNYANQMFDNLYTGLGVVGFKPYINFNSSETLNLQNGNLIYKFTDVTLDGRGIPLNISRIYNSQWTNPAYQGFVYLNYERISANYWDGQEFFENNPDLNNIAGMKLSLTQFVFNKTTFGDYLANSFFIFAGGHGVFGHGSDIQPNFITLTPGAMLAALQVTSALFLLQYATVGDTHATSLLLTHPQNQLTVNEVYAIIPKYPELDDRQIDSLDDIPQLVKRSSKLEKELGLILNDGSVMAFKYDPDKEAYLPRYGGKGYKIIKVENQYIVYTPAGLRYYLNEYKGRIYSSDPKNRVAAYIDIPYALPYKIDDYYGNEILIEREDNAPHNISKIIDTVGREITFARTDNEEILILPGNRRFIYNFDQSGNIIAITNPEGDITQYSYVAHQRTIDYINYDKTNDYLESVTYPTGAKVTYDGPLMITGRYEKPDVNYNTNITQFNYTIDVEDNNPFMLFQRTSVINAEGNETTYLFNNPYEENKKIKFPWTLTQKIEGRGEYDLITNYNWTESRNLEEIIVRKAWDGLKTIFDYDEYGNIAKITKNVPVKFDYQNNIVADYDRATVIEYDYEILVEDNIYRVNLPMGIFIDNGDNNVKIWYDYDIDPYINFDDDPNSTEKSTEFIKREALMGQLNRIRVKVQTGENEISKVIPLRRIFYDVYGNQRVIVDSEGNVSEIKYDANHYFPIENIFYKDVDGLTFTSERIKDYIDNDQYFGSDYLSTKQDYYFDRGLLKWVKDYNDNKTEYEYDLLGRLTKETLPDSSYQIKEYMNYAKDGTNQIITIYGTDDQNIVTKTIHNGLGWVTREEVMVEKPDQFVGRSYTHDNLGRVKTETDFIGNITSFEYDSLGRITKIDLPDKSNIRTQYAYMVMEIGGVEHFGLLTTIFDENGIKTDRFTDAEGKILRQVRYQRGKDGVFEEYEVAEFSYDSVGNLVEVKTPGTYLENGVKQHQTIRYTANESGNILRIVYPDGTTERLSYDTIGNLKEKVTKGNEIVNFEYDRLNRINEVSYSRNEVTDYLINNETDRIIYRYDEKVENGKGNLTSVIDNSGIITYTYNHLNQLKNVTQKLSGLDENWTTSYNYNAIGMVESITYPSDIRVSYRYNQRGLTEKVVLEDNGVQTEIASYTYNPNGFLKNMYQGNGIIQTEYNYNSRRWIDSIISQVNKETIFQEINQYDRVGNRIKITGTYGEETGYVYDDLERLTRVNFPGGKSKAYEYDEIGNRTLFTYQFDSGRDNYYQYTYNYNPINNHLERYSLSEYSYYDYSHNANGSVTEKNLLRGVEILQSSSYKYDLRNRLREVTLENKVTGGESTVRYDYNSDGWRIKTDTGFETTYYLYGLGINPLEERNGDNELQKLSIYANGQRIAILNRDKVVNYIISDLLGSTSVVTDSKGNELARYRYSPFGNLISSEGVIDEKYRFTGKEIDDMTGLYYYGARYYDPTIGRFITEDPAQDGWNWYVYTLNNPLKYIDPDGLWPRNPNAYSSSHELASTVESNRILNGFSVSSDIHSSEHKAIYVDIATAAVGTYTLADAWRFSKDIIKYGAGAAPISGKVVASFVVTTILITERLQEIDKNNYIRYITEAKGKFSLVVETYDVVASINGRIVAEGQLHKHYLLVADFEFMISSQHYYYLLQHSYEDNKI